MLMKIFLYFMAVVCAFLAFLHVPRFEERLKIVNEHREKWPLVRAQLFDVKDHMYFGHKVGRGRPVIDSVSVVPYNRKEAEAARDLDRGLAGTLDQHISFQYRYCVKDKVYVGSRVSRDSSTLSLSEALLLAVEPGGTIQVHYNPAAPQESFIFAKEYTFAGMLEDCVLIGGLLLAGALFFIVGRTFVTTDLKKSWCDSTATE